MTREEKDYILDTLERIRDETHQNNIMLKQICKVINIWLTNFASENENDFNRNVLANLISSFIDIKNLKR